jgi:hypothetical protein
VRGGCNLARCNLVSRSGSDANRCSLSSPCRSFAGALAQTSPGGPTIVGTGGTNGITFNSGGALNIQNCVIRGFTGAGLNGTGLNLVPTVSTDINVSNTIVSGNTAEGILLLPSGTTLTVTASFEQVQAIHNGGHGFDLNGSQMTGSLRAIAADSLASGNGLAGFASFSLFAQAATTLTVTNSKAANNGTGVQSQANNAAVFLNGSTVSGNPSNGFLITGGAVIYSYGNNAIVDTTNSGSLTPVALR